MLNILQKNPEQYIKAAQDKILVENSVSVSEIESAIAARVSAKAAKDWAAADAIRNEMSARGIVFRDGPTGTTWDVLL